eukprot:9467752-Pyramimonas_sp.AAC.1
MNLPSHLMDVAKVIADVKAAEKHDMLINTPFHAMADLDRAWGSVLVRGVRKGVVFTYLPK